MMRVPSWPGIPSIRSAWWTYRSLRRARRQLRHDGFRQIRLPSVPNVGREAERGHLAVLRRTNDSCLVRSTVRQTWHAARGRPRDLVIGVTAPSKGFRAHAWLEGDPPCHDEGFRELLRRPPGSVVSAV